MRVVLAPDSFKESLTAVEAAAAMAAGVHDVVPDAECVEVPMADGGEGFAQTVGAALGAQVHTVTVCGPLGQEVSASYVVDPGQRLAVLDVASACGLDLLPEGVRDVWRATSYGVGQLVRAALGHDVGTIVVGLGGSATNDGGAGMLAGLGARFVDGLGREVSLDDLGARGLEAVASVDLSRVDPRLGHVEIRLASDVTNPLLGPSGASAVFGPQKGASPQDVELLDALLGRLAGLVDPDGRSLESPGAGAAGGLGYAFQHVLGARSRSGVELVAELVGLDALLAGADLVLTGEGSMDAQTLSGKTPYGVARAAAAHGVPVIGFAGRLGEGADVLLEHGFAALVPIVQGVSDLPTALRDGGVNLRAAVATTMRVVLLPVGEASRPGHATV